MSKKDRNSKSNRKARTSSAQNHTSRATDPRLPKVGTLIVKRDRNGQARAKVRVVKGGFKYEGKLFRSLSGAAMAASGDLGLTSPTQNGFVFWGLADAAAA